MKKSPNPSICRIISAVDPATIVPPTDPIAKGEISVGVMSDDCKRLWWLYKNATDRVIEAEKAYTKLGEEHLERHSDPDFTTAECACYHKQAEKLNKDVEKEHRHREILRDLFWNAVRFEFPEIRGKAFIGVREGFQVVCKEGDPPLSLEHETMARLHELLTPKDN